MAKIWCFLAISMLIGISEISKCDSSDVNNSDTPAEENNKNTDVNTVKHTEDCYYPHRCNKRHYCGEPLYCDYAVYIGKRQKGDRQRWSKTFAKSKSSEQTSSVIQVVYPTPKKNSNPKITNEMPITYVHVEDRKKSNSIFNDTISIVAGGIGETFLSLNITSYNPKVNMKYKVIIFTKNKKQKKINLGKK